MWKYIRQLNAYMCPKCKHIRSYTPPYCEICGSQNGSEYDKRYVDELFEMSETDKVEVTKADAETVDTYKLYCKRNFEKYCWDRNMSKSKVCPEDCPSLVKELIK